MNGARLWYAFYLPILPLMTCEHGMWMLCRQDRRDSGTLLLTMSCVVISCYTVAGWLTCVCTAVDGCGDILPYEQPGGRQKKKGEEQGEERRICARAYIWLRACRVFFWLAIYCAAFLPAIYLLN